MRMSKLIAGAALAIGMAVSAVPSQAAPISMNMTLADTAAGKSLAKQVHYRPYYHGHAGNHRGEYRHRHHNRCRAWHNECADRWGWGTWRFRRCVIRHGC